MSNLPSTPWTNVSVDFRGPYPSGDYCLVMIGNYSRFHGMPEILKSDNGPPFQSFEFKNVWNILA